MPVAATEKLAVCPAVTVALAGSALMLGGTGSGSTVSIAALLVLLPTELLTTTWNIEFVSAMAVGGVV